MASIPEDKKYTHQQQPQCCLISLIDPKMFQDFPSGWEHTNESQNDGEQRGCWESDGHVHL